MLDKIAGDYLGVAPNNVAPTIVKVDVNLPPYGHNAYLRGVDQALRDVRTQRRNRKRTGRVMVMNLSW